MTDNSPLTATAEQVCRKRYFKKDKDGNPVEDWKQLTQRVVNHVCVNEPEDFKQDIYDILYSTKFLPNSPCLVNAGTSVNGLLACFVTKPPGDSWEEMCRNVAYFGHIARRGGGCGVDFSLIRPSGDPVFGSTHAKACGPIEHMRVVSEAMSSITQAGFRGMACLTGDSLISTELGFIPIREIVEDQKTGLILHTQFGSAKVLDAWHNGRKEVFEIISERGNKIKLTGDHLVYVVDKYNGKNHGKLAKKINSIGKWKKVSDLDIKLDCLVLNLDEKPFNSEYQSVDEIKLDENMAALISYTKCDGSLTTHKGYDLLQIVLDSNESLDFFTKETFGELQIDTKPQTGKGGTIRLQKMGSKVSFLRKFGEFGTYHCDVPSEIYVSPKSVVASFIRAAFDAEGTVDVSESRCRITLGMTSLEFVEGLHILLGMFGIQSSLRRDVVHVNKDGILRHNMHYLSISNKHHVRKFMDDIGFISKRKVDSANNALSRMSFGEGRGKSKSNKIIHRIKSITSLGEQDVFDISTSNETFLANNIVVHNCMGTMRVDHPDIFNFITCKQYDNALKTLLKEDIFNHYDQLKGGCHEHLRFVLDKFISNFNISIVATNEFMQAVKDDKDIDLTFNGKVYSTVKARDIFDTIAINAWNNGDPGLLFYDAMNSSPYMLSGQTITATNPCGEQCLPPFGSCNLGSIDVSKFYDSSTKSVNWKNLGHTIKCAVRFLDKVIDINKFPTKEFEEWAKDNRPVGLGIMGWADLLLKCKIAYGSKKSIEFAKELATFFEKEAHKASVDLGKEKGTPKCCDYKKIENRRNVTTISIAPTGSISLLAGCSSSIEPIYSPVIFRYDNTGSYEMPHPDSDKKYFRCALHPEDASKEVTWKQHIDMQAAFQAHCDSGISKTANMPNSATVDDVKEAYFRAWESGCKGITIYRDGSKTTQVLNTKSKPDMSAIKRPQSLDADIFKARADGMDWHIIVGKVNNTPYELFAVNGKQTLPTQGKIVKHKKKHYSLLGNDDEVLIDNIIKVEQDIDSKIDLETRRFSLELRHGIPPKYICQQIDKSNDIVTSFTKVTSRIFKKHYLEEQVSEGTLCPQCIKNGKNVEMKFESACYQCPKCHYSKCG